MIEKFREAYYIAKALDSKGVKQDFEIGYEMMCDLADAGYEDVIELLMKYRYSNMEETITNESRK